MDRTERIELTNMCMVSDGRGNVLIQRRRRGGWEGCTFPGGHIDPGESVVDSVHREVLEETGLYIKDVRICGIKQWDEGHRYLVLLFRADVSGGELTSSDEGEVFWCPLESVRSLNLAPDFDLMLDLFEREDLNEGMYIKDSDGWHYTAK